MSIVRTCLLVAAALSACRAPATLEPARPAPPPAEDPSARFVAGYVDRRVAPPALEPRTKLDHVAAACARSASDGYVVSASAVHEAMATQLGSGLWPHVLTAWGSDDEITARLDAALAELRATIDLVEIGSARASGRAGRVGVVVALPPPTLPIEVGRGSDTARITMPWPWREPPTAYAVTATSSRRLPAEVVEHSATQLALAVDCSRPAAIEVRAGARVVASVVDACGATVLVDSAGARPTDARLELGPPAHSRVEIEMRIFELLNRERAMHDRAPLAWDPDAHRFARAHATEMARHGYVGHQTPDGADLARRVEQASVRARRTRENVGRAWGPGEVHTAFMASTSHRANVLADDVARGAVGIAFDPADGRAFYVTEFFLAP